MFSVFCKRHYAKFLWVSILCCSMGGVCNALQPPQDKSAQQASPAQKGNPPQRPQRGNNDPFFNALLEAFKEASNNRHYLWVLLEHPAIQAEIGLDEAELKTLDELNHKHFEELKAIREKYKDKFDKVKVHKELVELINQQDAIFLEHVSKSCDFKRLIEIDVQAHGTRAVTHSEIAKRIGMSAERLSEVRAFCDKRRREEMEELAGKIQDVTRNQGAEGVKKVRELFRHLEQKLNDCLRSKLTSVEIDALNQLKGAPMELPEDLLEPRLRGPGPGNRRPESRGGDNKDRDKNGQSKDGKGMDKKDNCQKSWNLTRLITCC